MKRKIGNRILLFLAGTLLAAWLGTGILTIYLIFCLALAGLAVLYYSLLPASLPSTLDIPGTCNKGDKVTGYLHVIQEGRLPIFHGEAQVLIRSLTYGQEERVSLDIMLMGGEEGISAFDLKAPWFGMMEIILEYADIYGLFGLGKKRILSSVRKYLMVLPDTREMKLEIPPLSHPDPEGQEIREGALGYDPGIYQGVRPYQEGDSIKNIHWKMTGKTGEIMVRELGIPMGREPRLYLHTGFPVLDPPLIDQVMEDYISLSMAISATGQRHTLCWKNGGKDPVEYRVEVPGRLEETLEPLYHIVFAEEPGKDRDTRIYYMSHDRNTVYGYYHSEGVDSLVPVSLPEDIDTN